MFSATSKTDILRLLKQRRDERNQEEAKRLENEPDPKNFMSCDLSDTVAILKQACNDDLDLTDRERDMMIRQCGIDVHDQLKKVEHMRTFAYAYVPRKYRGLVDQIWDGIGSWRC